MFFFQYRFENDGTWIDGQDITGAGIDALIRVFYKKAHDRWLKNDTSVQALDRDTFALYSANVFTTFMDTNGKRFFCFLFLDKN